jgi:hypothetical protein
MGPANSSRGSGRTVTFWWAPAWFVLVAAVSGAACGPVRYASQVTSRADGEIEAADSAQALAAAPYEITIAKEYLHKAREEAGESRWERALDYGQKAERFALEAQAKAGTGAASGVGAGVPRGPAVPVDDGDDEPVVPASPPRWTPTQPGGGK